LHFRRPASLVPLSRKRMRHPTSWNTGPEIKYGTILFQFPLNLLRKTFAALRLIRHFLTIFSRLIIQKARLFSSLISDRSTAFIADNSN
jgi:hypothetical protein